MSKYPLVDKLGLNKYVISSFFESTWGVKCSDLERVLQAGSLAKADWGTREETPKCWFIGESASWLTQPTHTALLIAIEPIAKPDTAESLLREWVAFHACPQGGYGMNLQILLERAKKLLGEK